MERPNNFTTKIAGSTKTKPSVLPAFSELCAPCVLCGEILHTRSTTETQRHKEKPEGSVVISFRPPYLRASVVNLMISSTLNLHRGLRRWRRSSESLLPSSPLSAQSAVKNPAVQCLEGFSGCGCRGRKQSAYCPPLSRTSCAMRFSNRRIIRFLIWYTAFSFRWNCAATSAAGRFTIT